MIVRSTRTRGRAAVLSVGRTLKRADGTSEVVNLQRVGGEALLVGQILGRVLRDHRLDSRGNSVETSIDLG